MVGPPFSGTIMKVLGLKDCENRMRMHADRMNRRSLGYSRYPKLYNYWQEFPQYQHHYRNSHPIQSHGGRLYHASAADRNCACSHHHGGTRRREEELFAQMHGRHPRRRPHSRRLRRHHDIDEDYDDEDEEGDIDEGFEEDGYTDSASSTSYERTRHGHDRRHRPHSHGLHGRHPPRGIPSHGGWHGRLDYGGYPEHGSYEDRCY